MLVDSRRAIIVGWLYVVGGCSLLCLGSGCRAPSAEAGARRIVHSMERYSLHDEAGDSGGRVFSPHLRDALIDSLSHSPDRADRLVAVFISPVEQHFEAVEYWMTAQGGVYSNTLRYGIRRVGDEAAPKHTWYVAGARQSEDPAVASLYRNLRACVAVVENAAVDFESSSPSHPAYTFLVIPEQERVLPVRRGHLGVLALSIAEDLGISDDELEIPGTVQADQIMDAVLVKWLRAGLGMPEVIDALLFELDRQMVEVVE